MNTTQIDIRFEGNNFTPSALQKELGLSLNILVEAGEISKKGQFRGKPSPYGIAYHTIDHDLELEDSIPLIEKYLNKLIKNQSILDKVGVEEIIFDIETLNSKAYSYSLDTDIIKKLEKLNARIDFHGNELEVAIDNWLNTIYQHSDKFLGHEKSSNLNILRNKIIHSSPHIHVYNISHIYEFLFLYTIKHLGEPEDKIPSFEKSFLEYEKAR